MSECADLWLRAHGLEQYADRFRDNDVDMRALPHLTEDDLRELGVSLGHRRIFLAALRALSPGPDIQTAVPTPGEATPPAPPPETDAEHRHLSVIFVDMVGSTQLIERIDPEDMRDLLRQYQDMVASVVTRFGGHVAKYMGDGILAYFGWPIAYESHAESAVRAGLEIIRSASLLRSVDKAKVSVRAGIASGSVVIGDLIGAQMREADAMTGAVVNLAARLQAEASSDALVLSEEVRLLIGDAFELRSLGKRRLKGFTQAREIWQATGERILETRFEATRGASSSAPLVGRDAELALIAQRWRLAAGGNGQVILLSGEAGIGKSRMAEAILTIARETPHTLLRFQCSPYHVHSAFHPIIERLSRAAGLVAGDPAAENLKRIDALTDAHFLDRARDGPVYAALLGVHAPSQAEGPTAEPVELKRRIIRTLRQSVVERAMRQPMLMIVEDAHWIDPSTREAFERLIELSGELAVMLVVTHRPEWTCDWAETNSNVTSLRLNRLGQEHVAALAREILTEPPSQSVIDDLMARTDGVPLFVEEVARALQENGPANGAKSVPTSLQGMLLSRLDRVSRDARQLSLIASVIGRDFDAKILTAVADQSPGDVDIALNELRKANIIFESGVVEGLYSFRHALLQDAAYQALLRPTRRQLHERCAIALEQLRPDIAEREPEVIAHHFSEAGDDARALEGWMAAARKALRRSGTYEAVSHAREALAAAERCPESMTRARSSITARLLLSRAHTEAGNLPKAVSHSLKASQEARALDDPTLFADAAATYSESTMLAGNSALRAVRICQTALADARLTDQGRRCKLMAQLTRAHMLVGEFEEGRRIGHEAEALARATGDKAALFSQMMSRFLIPTAARDMKEVEGWRKRILALLEIADETGDMDRGRAASIATYVATEMGDRALMDDALGRLEAVGAARQHMQVDWIARHGRAMEAILDGDFRRAERLAEEAKHLSHSTLGDHVDGLYGVQMFSIRREQGRLAEVAPVMKRLLAEEAGDADWKPGFALVAAELGHLAPARRMMEEMMAAHFDLPLDAKYSATLAYLADTAALIADQDMAEMIYNRLLPYRDMTITMGVATVCYGAAGRRLGTLAAMLGLWEAAEAHFERALELDRAMRAVPWLAHTRADYADALLRRGRASDVDKAYALKSEALEVARKSDMVALESKLRATFQ